MEKRPRIGITMRIDFPTERFYLSRHYSEAIEAAGGVPVHISLIPDEDYIRAVIAGLDGVLLPGSDSDVDPLRYGQQPHQALGAVQAIKDETDLLVLAAGEQTGIPILAICFGLQVLNVYRGGSLIEDIAAQLPGAIKHEQGAPRDRPSHSVRLLPESMIARLATTNELLVNSHHHQAIDVIGRDLVATAWASDGVVEAMEDPRSDRSVLAVQWHPELGWENDTFSQKLFKHFVNQAISNVHVRS